MADRVIQGKEKVSELRSSREKREGEGWIWKSVVGSTTWMDEGVRKWGGIKDEVLVSGLHLLGGRCPIPSAREYKRRGSGKKQIM